MTYRILRQCQKCWTNGYCPLRIAARVYHANNLPFTHRHAWHPLDQLPNKFVKMYRDIHGPTLRDREAAREFVFALKPQERECLLEELHEFAETPNTVCLHQTLPFIGFGFLDNFLMIVAGEYIDMTMGAALGISTMAAAGLGNLISDVAGVGCTYYVEAFVVKFGFRSPHLNAKQVDMKSTRWAASMGRVLGVAIGCFLGMCPLLFYDERERQQEEPREKKT